VTPDIGYPTLSQIRLAADRLAGKILTTPVWRWQTGIIEATFDESTEVWLKLELFQRTGTFKLRGALNCAEALDATARRHGVVTVSAGNHADAAARQSGSYRHVQGIGRRSDSRARRASGF